MRTISKDQLLTSHEVGSLLQMDPSSVVKWVNDGLLPAYRTPGGHRRIRAADLIGFLNHHQMYVPPVLSTATRVLVVDNDAEALRAIARSAKGHDELAVSTCGNAIEALVRLGAEPPAAVVISAKLAELDALALVRQLKEARATEKVAAIVATDAPTPHLEKKALELGAIAVVAKPFTAATLVEILQRTPTAG